MLTAKLPIHLIERALSLIFVLVFVLSSSIADIKLLDQSEGLTWFSGSKIKKLNDISFWIGKRAQSGKKVPKYFNKNFKFE